MKRRPLAILVLSSVLMSAGCSSNIQSPTQLAENFITRQSITPLTKENYLPKNPKHIAIYNKNQKPLSPYRIIGVARVSQYNLIGVKRQDETVKNMLQKLAASIGGDAIIDIDLKNNDLKANVIQFQKILI